MPAPRAGSGVGWYSATLGRDASRWYPGNLENGDVRTESDVWKTGNSQGAWALVMGVKARALKGLLSLWARFATKKEEVVSAEELWRCNVRQSLTRGASLDKRKGERRGAMGDWAILRLGRGVGGMVAVMAVVLSADSEAGEVCASAGYSDWS